MYAKPIAFFAMTGVIWLLIHPWAWAGIKKIRHQTPADFSRSWGMDHFSPADDTQIESFAWQAQLALEASNPVVLKRNRLNNQKALLNWGRLPSGQSYANPVIAQGHLWLFVKRDGEWQLYKSPVNSSRAVWQKQTYAISGEIRKFYLDQAANPWVLLEKNRQDYRLVAGAFTGGGKKVIWDPSEWVSKQQAQQLRRPIPHKTLYGEFDLGTRQAILSLRWDGGGEIQSVRYRLARDQEHAYGPWSHLLTGDSVRIGRNARFLQYALRPRPGQNQWHENLPKIVLSYYEPEPLSSEISNTKGLSIASSSNQKKQTNADHWQYNELPQLQRFQENPKTLSRPLDSADSEASLASNSQKDSPASSQPNASKRDANEPQPAENTLSKTGANENSAHKQNSVALNEPSIVNLLGPPAAQKPNTPHEQVRHAKNPFAPQESTAESSPDSSSTPQEPQPSSSSESENNKKNPSNFKQNNSEEPALDNEPNPPLLNPQYQEAENGDNNPAEEQANASSVKPAHKPISSGDDNDGPQRASPPSGGSAKGGGENKSSRSTPAQPNPHSPQAGAPSKRPPSLANTAQQGEGSPAPKNTLSGQGRGSGSGDGSASYPMRGSSAASAWRKPNAHQGISPANSHAGGGAWRANSSERINDATPSLNPHFFMASMTGDLGPLAMRTRAWPWWLLLLLAAVLLLRKRRKNDGQASHPPAQSANTDWGLEALGHGLHSLPAGWEMGLQFRPKTLAVAVDQDRLVGVDGDGAIFVASMPGQPGMDVEDLGWISPIKRFQTEPQFIGPSLQKHKNQLFVFDKPTGLITSMFLDLKQSGTQLKTVHEKGYAKWLDEVEQMQIAHNRLWLIGRKHGQPKVISRDLTQRRHRWQEEAAEGLRDHLEVQVSNGTGLLIAGRPQTEFDHLWIYTPKTRGRGLKPITKTAVGQKAVKMISDGAYILLADTSTEDNHLVLQILSRNQEGRVAGYRRHRLPLPIDGTLQDFHKQGNVVYAVVSATTPQGQEVYALKGHFGRLLRASQQAAA